MASLATSLGYRTDLAIRAAEGGQVDDCGDHVVVRTPQNPSYRWGNFILLKDPPAASAAPGWLARFAECFPGARHHNFGVDVADSAAMDGAAFAAAAGLRAAVDVVLTASASGEPRHRYPAADIRALAGDQDWRQSILLRLACDAGQPGPLQDFVERRTSVRRALTEAGGATWFGAFVAGRLVAQLGLVPVGDGLARYQDVETHPDFRGRGLAGTLVAHAARRGLVGLGASTLVIVAEPGSQACRIYESAGFARREEQISFTRS